MDGIRVKFLDEEGQYRLILVNDIGQNHDNTIWIGSSELDISFESIKPVDNIEYNNMLDKALVYGYADLTSLGRFKMDEIEDDDE